MCIRLNLRLNLTHTGDYLQVYLINRIGIIDTKYNIAIWRACKERTYLYNVSALA